MWESVHQLGIQDISSKYDFFQTFLKKLLALYGTVFIQITMIWYIMRKIRNRVKIVNNHF